MSRMLPEALRDRPELNLRPGIKSSLNNWRQLIASLYLFYLYTLDGGECVYGKEMSSSGQKSLRIKDEFSAWLDVRCANLDNAKQLVQNCPLFAAQMEPLQVGIELFLKLAKVDFVNSSLPYSAERTGGNRYAKQLRFSTNMKVLGDVLSIFSNAEREGFLKSWLNGIDDSIVCERIKEILLTFTEECQYKIRTTSSEIFFRQDGIYERLRGGGNTVESSDVHESVGPFRILKSYVKDGMHPYLVDSTDGFKIKVEVHVLEKYADMVQTTLGLIPKRTTIYQEVESSPGALSLPTPECNADRLTVALKLFAEQRATWRAAMDKNKGPTYQFVNADVRAFFGKKENWDVEKLKSAEGFENFCLHHTWMLSNGKAWPSLSHYDDAERAKLVDWIDEKIVNGIAALQNVIVDDNGLKGFTNKAVSELLMKFHPESYILCNGPTIDSLKFLRSEWAVKGNYSYADYLKVLGAAAVIRDRMAEMKIYATLDGTTPPDFLAVNEFIFFVSENKDLIEDVIKENAKMSDESKMKDVDKKVTTKQGALKPLTAGDPDDLLMLRLKSALRAKPFVILAGHSGTGKSRIVRKLAYMTCNVDALMDQERGPQNFKMIQVKPNWHDSSDLLGYRSAIKDNVYVGTELIKFIFKAYTYPDTPFFLCLDEMNLAPVEQYFAEFLSAMESMKPKDSDDVEGKGDFVSDPVIDLDVSDKATKKDTNLWELGCESKRAYQWVKDHGFTIPKNLFVVGTVNMDESTNQFSRKVLDRAMTIEMTEASFANYGKVSEPSYADFEGNDEVAKLLKRPVRVKELVGDGEDIQTKEPKLLEVQDCLKETSFAIAFRFANEYVLYRKALKEFDGGDVMKVDALDHMVLMKVLPRIVGETEYVSNIFCGNRDPKNRANPTPKSLMGILSDPKMLSHDKMSQILKRGEEGASYLTFWP